MALTLAGRPKLWAIQEFERVGLVLNKTTNFKT